MRSALYDDDSRDDDDLPENARGRLWYRRGCEAEAGDFKVVSLGEGIKSVIDRLSRYREIGDSTDSPIEDLMGASLLMFFGRTDNPLTLCKTLDVRAARDGLLLVPQFKWSFYRSDWAIFNPTTQGALLIECDGKDFHSSPEQLAHDAKKDQAAIDRGFLTMRFPGWRINKDPDGCAQKIYDAVYG